MQDSPLSKCFFVVICAILSFPAMAQERWQVPGYKEFGQAPSEKDAKSIQNLMSQFREAWANQQTDAILATHTDDIEWINAFARIFRGKEALKEFLENRLFPAFDPSVSKKEVENMKPISLRYIGSNTAILHWYTEGNRGRSRNQGERLRRTHLHFVLSKEETWKIAHLAIFDARK